jgi:hypothetical protein
VFGNAWRDHFALPALAGDTTVAFLEFRAAILRLTDWRGCFTSTFVRPDCDGLIMTLTGLLVMFHS